MRDRNQYLSRKEFLELCGITKNTLVWYEKIGLIQPEFIGENGYHYYSKEQFFEIDLIKSLKWTDSSLLDCKEYMNSRSPEKFLNMLLNQQLFLEQKLAILTHQKNTIDQSLRDFLRMQARYTVEPKLVECPPFYILMQEIEEKTSRGYIIALSKLFDLFHNIIKSYEFISSMYNRALVTKDDILAENFQNISYVCMTARQQIDHPACRAVPGGTFLVCFHTGPVRTIGRTYERMMGLIQRENMEVTGDALESDYINYLSEKDPDRFSKEILIPVCKRK